MEDVVKIGLIGFGTVGTGVVKLLYSNEKPFRRGRDFDLDLLRIADLDITTDRGLTVPVGVLTTHAEDVLNDRDIRIVVELIGGYEPARTFTLRAFERGKSVVTANKALVARYGSELFRAAANAGVSYMFEAAVGGGIPLIRGIFDGLNANRIESIYGILNGTTNYILTGMARDGLEYDAVLRQAQSFGYAEADPTSDVSGADALNKIVILARLAFGASLAVDDVFCEGIDDITIEDIRYARELGCEIKLLAIAKRHEGNLIEVRVHPTLVPSDSVIASVEDEFNAVEIYGDAVGREIFYGKGAGMMPTASAVVSDIVDVASRIMTGAPTNVSRIVADGNGPGLIDISDLMMRYYLRFSVIDKPGVLAAISRIFADENISIESVIQKGSNDGETVPLVILTHESREGDMRRATERFGKLEHIRGAVQLIRVEEI